MENLSTLGYGESDTWDIVEKLIRLLIRREVNTCIPAEVVEVKEGRVSVRSLVMPKEADVPPVVFHNIMAVLPGGGSMRLSYPLSKGDQGLLITCKLDMIEFKKTLVFSKTKTGRTFDMNDSVFLPILFNKEPLDKEEVTLVYNEKEGKDTEDTTKIVLSKKKVKVMTGQSHITLQDNTVSIVTQGKGEVVVQGDLVDLRCERLKCAPLKAYLDAVLDLMDQLSKGLKGSGSNPAEYLAKKPTYLQTFTNIDE